MLRVIKEEPVSFGSRLNELMKEKKIRNKDIADLLGCTKTAVSDWRTGKHFLRRHKEEYCSKLAVLFDVDPEYLLCTQLERKRSHKRHKRRISLHDKYFDPYTGLYWKKQDFYEIDGKKYGRFEQVAIKRAGQKKSAEMRSHISATSEMLKMFDRMGITIESEIIGSGINSHEYEILEDGMIKTVIQEEEYPRHSNRYIVTLPDGSEWIRTMKEIKEIYQSMLNFCVDRFSGKISGK